MSAILYGAIHYMKPFGGPVAPINMAMYGFTAQLIQNQIPGLTGIAAGMVGGLVVSKIINPKKNRHVKPMDAIFIKATEISGALILGLGVLGLLTIKRTFEENYLDFCIAD